MSSSLQTLPTTSTVTQVASANPARGGEAPHLFNPTPSISPNVSILLSNIATISRLAQITQDQVLQADAAATSNTNKYEKAYIAEYHKLQQTSELNNEMGRENDFLQQEIVKWEARYNELNELNTLIEKGNESLEDKNMQLEETIEELQEKIRILKLELYQGGDELLSEQKQDDEVPAHSPAHATTRDEKDSVRRTASSYVATVEPATTKGSRRSLKRKHCESEDDKEQRSTRQRN